MWFVIFQNLAMGGGNSVAPPITTGRGAQFPNRQFPSRQFPSRQFPGERIAVFSLTPMIVLNPYATIDVDTAQTPLQLNPYASVVN
jgi:hypothetical protein